MIKSTSLLALLLVLGMFAVAERTGLKEIIFPEISALALGAWVMDESPWGGSAPDLWLFPTMAAFTGTVCVRFFPYFPVVMIAAAFCIVLLQLILLRGSILPAISAALLPIVTRSGSWYYPLSVCILSGAIACGNHLRGSPRPDRERRLPPELAHWSKLLAGVVLVSAFAVGTGRIFIVAPPLIVMFVELSKPDGALREKKGKVLALLLFSAFSGAFLCEYVHTVLGRPAWVAASLSTALTFAAYHLIRMPFPPAVAIALLPLIVPKEEVLLYPWQVSCGSIAFILLSTLCFGNGGRPAVKRLEQHPAP